MSMAEYWQAAFKGALLEANAQRREDQLKACCEAASAARHNLVYELSKNHPMCSEVQKFFRDCNMTNRLRIVDPLASVRLYERPKVLGSDAAVLAAIS